MSFVSVASTKSLADDHVMPCGEERGGEDWLRWYDWNYGGTVYLHDPWILSDFASDVRPDISNQHAVHQVKSSVLESGECPMIAIPDVSGADTKPLSLPTWSSIQNSHSPFKSTESTSQPTSPLVQQQLCLVCNDVSTGKHFGVLSCEACKSFFRRSIRSTSSYVCRGTKCCKIDRISRNKCQHCRLQKCIDVGMNKKGNITM